MDRRRTHQGNAGASLRALQPYYACALFQSHFGGVTHSGPGALGVVSTAFGATFLLLFPVFLPRQLRRDFAKRPDRNSEMAWTIREIGLATKSTHGSSDVAWSAFAKVVQTADGFLFYPVSQIFHWLPRHGFVSDADINVPPNWHALTHLSSCKTADNRVSPKTLLKQFHLRGGHAKMCRAEVVCNNIRGGVVAAETGSSF